MDPDSLVASQPERGGSDAEFCPDCGAAVALVDVYCPECGSILAEKTEGDAEAETGRPLVSRTSSTAVLWALFGAGAVLALIGLLLAAGVMYLFGTFRGP